MDVKDRRNLLGGLAALLIAPFVLGRGALARTLAPRSGKRGPEPLPAPRITPPADSVKRRG